MIPNTKPRIAITMGDPAGIGPEIITKALSTKSILQDVVPVIVGSKRALERAFQFTKQSFPFHTLTSVDELTSIHEDIGLWNDEQFLLDEIPLARVDASCGASAFAWLDRAVDWCKRGWVDAIVTAPLHKEALHLAGHHYPGHTEILAEKTGITDFSLMLIAGNFRVTHVTCHTAISNVPGLLSKQRVLDVIRLLNDALTRLDGKAPTIAVCALNPHGGEGGLFGDEEIRFIRPAVEQAQAEGILAEGPFPCDSIYPKHIGGVYDGVVAMYHDQGHIAFKLTNFHFDPQQKEWETVVGVNVTLGLPIIRTSVDHGTAFDLAGTGKASERSLLDAIDVAVKMVRGKSLNM